MSIPGVDLRVEIAFDSGYRTPAADRTWTDVTDYVELSEGIDIEYGRADEISVADANRLKLTLDNTDARFTWGNAASPYYPNLKLGRPIRVIATIAAVDYVRFTGYVDEWPTAWPGGGDTYATAPITASSRLSRLGLNSPLVNLLERTIVELEPDLYWPLTELRSPAAEIEGRAPSLYGNALTVFGSGVDEGKPTEFFGGDGKPVVKTLPGLVEIGEVSTAAKVATTFWPPRTFSGDITFSVFVKKVTPANYDGVTYTGFMGFYPIDNTGALGMSYDRPEYSIHPTEVSGTHLLAFTREQTSPTTFTLTNYFDGEVIRTTSGTASAYTELIQVSLNPGPGIEFGRFAMWDRVLSSAELTRIADVGIGAAGDTTDERVERVASWEGIAPTEIITTPSPITMSSIIPEGGQIVELLRHAETTEAGVLYDDRDGNIVLRPRADRYAVEPSVELDVATQQVGADFAPRVGRQGLVNVATARNAAGTAEATYADEESREDYGNEGYDVETHAENPDEPLMLAAAQVNANNQPRPRAPSVTIQVLDWVSGSSADDILSLDIGSKVRIANAPDQAPEATADYFTEGYSESFGEAAWSLSLNLSTAWPADSAFILNDAVYGELDAGNLLAL